MGFIAEEVMNTIKHKKLQMVDVYKLCVNLKINQSGILSITFPFFFKLGLLKNG